MVVLEIFCIGSTWMLADTRHGFIEALDVLIIFTPTSVTHYQGFFVQSSDTASRPNHGRQYGL